MGKLVSAARLSAIHGVHEQTIRKWGKDGVIPSVLHGKQVRFNPELVADALKGNAAIARQVGPGLRRCSKCAEVKGVEAFTVVKCSRTGKRGPCSHCKACRQMLKRHREAAKRRTQTERIDRVRVAERDGWMCSICGDAVTRSNWSLDHVKPLSRGGTHTYDNVAIAHARCNSSKKDRYESPQ